jgi:hypothetical protein
MSNRVKTRTRLRIDSLEDRLVPATVFFSGGSLTVSNPMIGAGGTTSLTLTATGANKIQVMDGTTALGTYAVTGNLTVNGSNAPDSVTVDLAGFSFTGNVTISTGNGNDTIDMTNSSATAASVAGNVTLSSGLGNDSVSVSSASAGVLKFGSSVLIQDTQGNDSFTFGNGSASTTLSGNLTVNGPNNVQLGQGSNDAVGGNITVTQGTHGGHLSLEQGLISGTEVLSLGGNFNVFSNNQSADVFLRGEVLSGSLNVHLGAGMGPDPAFGQPGNFFGLSSSPSTITTINGDLNYSSGSGADSLDLGSGVVHGNMGITVGDGNVNISLETFTSQTIINGNLTINAGNGNDLIGPLAGDGGNQALIGGNVSLRLGNGDDTTSFNAGGSVGGTITYLSGNGNDSFNLAGAQAYNVNVTFGNGNDTFTLNNAAAVLTGRVDGGGQTTADVFNPVAGTIASPFLLINFP